MENNMNKIMGISIFEIGSLTKSTACTIYIWQYLQVV